jgi:hypothetical protein
MGQTLIDIGLDKALGVLIIVASFYFGIKMYLMSRDPREDSVLGRRARNEDGRYVADDPSTETNEAYYGGKKLRKSLKTKKKTD